VVKVAGHPIGLIQSYITDDYPEHAESLQMPGWVGIDYFIGDKKYVGRRYGPTMILDFRAKVVVNYYPEAPGLVADPETDNVASIRALEKAGFVKDRIACGEHGQEQLMTLRLGT
jgi:RimJ/RimL family protein N-acetyltransferase